MKHFTCLLLVTVVCVSEAHAQGVTRTIPYATAHERQVLDVHAPAGAKNLPVAFWIHGGGWQTGDKSMVALKPKAFMDAGFVFVSINHRLLPAVDMGAITRDVASALVALEAAVLEYGGLDILVSNAGIAHSSPVDRMALADWERSFAVNSTGHFLVAREAMRILIPQGLGGSLVFVATKNVMSPGKDFAAYSAAKAAEAQLAKVLALEGAPHNIRSNIVNPDAIFQDSKLWSEEIRRERAAAQGIGVDQLEDFYRKRNLLGARILPEDVAQAVLFLASDRSAKTTGCTITVDGGVKDAFPR